MSQSQPISSLEPEKPYSQQTKQSTSCNSCVPFANGWGWLVSLFIWFVLFTVLFWLIFFSLKPAFVLQNESSNVDTARVLLAAVISASVLVITIWLIKVTMNRR